MSCWIHEETSTCFIHIPKTGGTSINAYFSDKYLKKFNLNDKSDIRVKKITHHSNIDYIVNNLNSKPQYTFSIVRNPWDRLVSWYFYYCNSQGKKEDVFSKIEKVENLTLKNDLIKYYNYWFEGFDSFICNCLDNSSIWKHGQTLHSDFWYTPSTNQSEWIFTKNNSVDEFFKTEEMDKCWTVIKERFDLNENINLPYVRKSKHKHYKEYYSDKTKKKVNEVYEKDIELFKYTF
jgi:hypothetical protein